jgi:two-component system, NtrC family, sensor histidine kinase PilS
MADEDRLEQSFSLKQKLWWLIWGRLAAALLLLIVGTIWVRSSTGQPPWGKTFPLLAMVIALTVVYSIAHRFSQDLLLQIRLQFAIDIALITWLVWTSDVTHSPYIALYIVVIGIAGLYLGPRDAVVISVVCAVAFTSCAVAAITGLGNHPLKETLESSVSQSVQAVGLFDIAFLVVGLLSARLAGRQSRSDVRLMAATQSLASLRALHERIVESIRSGLVTTDLEGRIYSFNTAATEITGYTEESLRGKHASIFFGEMKEQTNASLAAAAAGEASPRFESECRTAEGLRLRLGFTIAPLFSEDSQTTGTVIAFQDLTHIRALEESSRRQDRLAAIGRMAASIAHEIRNPLAAMRGSIQMLRSEMGEESSQTELMEIILRESDRLNRIISDFLNYARPRSIVHATVDVGQLLEQTFTLMRHSPEVNEKQVIEAHVSDGPLTANVDAEQLRQVFWNLSRNALQAMPKGGLLKAEMSRNSHNRLHIVFSDTGRGMSPEQVEHLFEPFSSTTGGTGLGLSIVYQIIRDHGGTITVRSREGSGTTITIELPSDAPENGELNPDS